MRHLLTSTFYCCLFILLISFSCQEKAENVSLFDGQSLQGWEGDPAFFTVKEGAIVAGRLVASIPRNEFLVSDKVYGDFELQLKAKLVGPGDNGGVQFRSQRVEGSSEMYGYQADIGFINASWVKGFEDFSTLARGMEDDAQFPLWGSLYDESRRRKPLALGDPAEVMKNLHQGEWNDLKIRAEGNRIRIWLNDVLITDYEETEDVAKSGYLGLQVHSGPPLEVWYKDIFIQELQ